MSKKFYSAQPRMHHTDIIRYIPPRSFSIFISNKTKLDGGRDKPYDANDQDRFAGKSCETTDFQEELIYPALYRQANPPNARDEPRG